MIWPRTAHAVRGHYLGRYFGRIKQGECVRDRECWSTYFIFLYPGYIDRITKQEEQFLFESFGPFHVLPDVGILMEVEVQGIHLMFNRAGNAIFGLLFFWLVSAKQAIPENEGGAVVLVDVLLLRAMVHAVIGRRGKQVF